MDLYKEGKYIDLWSVPHVLSGVILAIIFNHLGMSFWLNFILSIIIMTWWEFFEEHVLNAREFLTNKIMDVVTGVIGFIIVYPFIIKYGFSVLFPYLLLIIYAFLMFNLAGFRAHLIRISKKKGKK